MQAPDWRVVQGEIRKVDKDWVRKSHDYNFTVNAVGNFQST